MSAAIVAAFAGAALAIAAIPTDALDAELDRRLLALVASMEAMEALSR